MWADKTAKMGQPNSQTSIKMTSPAASRGGSEKGIARAITRSLSPYIETPKTHYRRHPDTIQTYCNLFALIGRSTRNNACIAPSIVPRLGVKRKIDSGGQNLCTICIRKRSPDLPTAKDLCLADLRRRILVTELVPGAELEETTLAADYNLSRTPLREVLQRLAGEGYVEIAENRGARVASMDIATMRTFFQTAPMIYANVGKLAAENRTEGQVETLEAAQSAFRDACDACETRDMAMANHRFHAVTVDMAANPYLAVAMDRLLINHTRMAISFYNTATDTDAARVSTAIAQHEGRDPILRFLSQASSRCHHRACRPAQDQGSVPSHLRQPAFAGQVSAPRSVLPG